MRPLEDCIKEEKSKADKMFERLGYTISNFPDSHIIKYYIDRDNEFHFVYSRIIFHKRLKK